MVKISKRGERGDEKERPSFIIFLFDSFFF